MIQKFIIFSFFWIYMLGCENTDNHLMEPKAPMHELHIDGDVQFSAEITWSPSNDSLNTKILAENVGTDTAIVETGSCAFNIIAYNENREPVWYNRMVNDYICTDELLIYNIAPKDTKHLADQMYISGQNWC